MCTDVFLRFSLNDTLQQLIESHPEIVLSQGNVMHRLCATPILFFYIGHDQHPILVSSRQTLDAGTYNSKR